MRKDWSKLLPVIQKMVSEGESIKTIADTIEVNRRQLLTKMSKWRAEGIDVPYEQGVPDGDTRVKIIKGVKYKYIKTEEGWKSQGRVQGQKVAKRGRKASAVPRKPQKSRYVKKVKISKPPKPEKVRKEQVYKQPKRVDKVLITRVVDDENYKYVPIGDGKTTIRIRKGADSTEAIAKWLKGREDALNLLKRPGNNRLKP